MSSGSLLVIVTTHLIKSRLTPICNPICVLLFSPNRNFFVCLFVVVLFFMKTIITFVLSYSTIFPYTLRGTSTPGWEDVMRACTQPSYSIVLSNLNNNRNSTNTCPFIPLSKLGKTDNLCNHDSISTTACLHYQIN